MLITGMMYAARDKLSGTRVARIDSCNCLRKNGLIVLYVSTSNKRVQIGEQITILLE